MLKNLDVSGDTSLNHILEHSKLRKDILRSDHTVVLPWLRSCSVKVLLVTDGNLNFGLGDFGLSAFINCLQQDGRFYVKFDITLAHLREDVSDEEMGSHTSNIVQRFKGFRFDDPAMFTDTKYDQVWLFGIETNLNIPNYYPFRASNSSIYPLNSLANAELLALSSFMNKGGGVFATGDHGFLGAPLCGSINRVRSMRLWASTSSVNNLDEVSMTGARRNDTNQLGDVGSQFSDQSDDIPQTIEHAYYYQKINRIIEVAFPHPLLCSRLGLIDVLPDHPHEGECIEPNDVSRTYLDGLEEFPLNSDGVRFVPEVIAWSRVRAGNLGVNTKFSPPSKQPTIAQTFGAITAYDGHRANVGRVVTDATWHHFVNVNLIGLVEGGIFDDLTASNSATKHDGFLSTDAGKAHFAKIKEYYVNIGVWIAPPSRIECFNSKLLWKLVYSDRVMESALVDPEVHFSKIPLNLFYSIGVHAVDVLGRSTSRCQAVKFLIDIYVKFIPELIPRWDPWMPVLHKDFLEEPPMPTFDPSPLITTMLGTSLVAIRQAFPYPPKEIDEKFEYRVSEILQESSRISLEMGLEHYLKETESYHSLLKSAYSNLLGKRDQSQV